MSEDASNRPPGGEAEVIVDPITSGVVTGVLANGLTALVAQAASEHGTRQVPDRLQAEFLEGILQKAVADLARKLEVGGKLFTRSCSLRIQVREFLGM